jgi:hypothetical protein
MPTTSVNDAYAEWLATPPTTGMLVETIEIVGNAIGSPIRLCNRRDIPFEAADENGVPRIYNPLSFTFSKPAIRNSSEYVTTVRIDGLQGTLLQLFGRIRSIDLTSPVYATLRLYIDPTMVDRPVSVPLRFRCENIKVTLDVIEMELVGGRMPTKRAGMYYVLERFVGLKPF